MEEYLHVISNLYGSILLIYTLKSPIQRLSGFLQAFPDDGFHLLPFVQHILAQGNLAAGADEVVLGIADVEIGVSTQVVVQEPGGQLGGEHNAAQTQGIGLQLGHGFGRHIEKTFCKCPEHLHIHTSLGGIGAVLFTVVGGETNGIAEIMAHKAGHDGIQINYHKGAVILRAEQNVVDFCVVVGYPQGKLAGLLHIRQGAGQFLNIQKKLNLIGNLSGPANGILRNGLAEIFKPPAGVVEIGNGFVQGPDIKVRQLVLEFTKGSAGIVQHQGILNAVVGNGGNVVCHPPEIVAVNDIGFPVGGVVKMQTDLAGALSADVLGNLIDVFHQADGIAESIGVDILNQEGFGTAVLQKEIDLVGPVDIPHLNGFVSCKGILDSERFADLVQLII